MPSSRGSSPPRDQTHFSYVSCVVRSLSYAQLFCDAMVCSMPDPLSTEFSRQEYWSWLHFLLQRIFLTQGLNLHILHWQADSLPLSHQGSPPVSCYSCLLPPVLHSAADAMIFKLYSVSLLFLFYLFFRLFILYWGTADEQCCDSFR